VKASLFALLLLALGWLPAAFAAGDADVTARAIAGKEISPYWNLYETRIGGPLQKWGCQELGRAEGATVFYPFSGPDLPTVLRLFPGAERYVLVSAQAADAPPRLEKLSKAEVDSYLAAFHKAWRLYGALGFFRTDDLDAADAKQSAQGVRIGMTAPLMAFSVRLGFTIEAIEPIRMDQILEDYGPWSLSSADPEKWDSVRLTLRKGGRTVLVDYVHMNLSNDWLGQWAIDRKWIERMAANPTLLKAASHLPQEADFTILRDSLLAKAPLIVQDETGIEYGALAKVFSVRLYGKFTSVNPSFGRHLQRSLAAAYQRGGAKPLPFRIGYEKNSGSAMQVANRETRTYTASRDCR
jgi:hypothetical protein